MRKFLQTFSVSVLTLLLAVNMVQAVWWNPTTWFNDDENVANVSEEIDLGATKLFPYQGGTGTTTAPSQYQILQGGSGGVYDVVSDLTLSGYATTTGGLFTTGNLKFNRGFTLQTPCETDEVVTFDNTTGEMTCVYNPGGGSQTWKDPVKDRNLAAPPATNSTGDRYIVASGGEWYEGDTITTKYRKEIVIESDLIDEDLTDPVLVWDYTSSTDPLFTRTQADGDDIVFVNDSDQSVDLLRMKEEFNQETQRATFHIQVSGTVSASSDTTLYVYYGDADVCVSSSDGCTDSTGIYDGDWGTVYWMTSDTATQDKSDYGQHVEGGEIGDLTETLTTLGYGQQGDGNDAWDMACSGCAWEDTWGTEGTLTARTKIVLFETGDNVTSRQTIYAEGGGSNGDLLYILNGRLYMRQWAESNSWGNWSTQDPVHQSLPISASTVYVAVAKFVCIGGGLPCSSGEQRLGLWDAHDSGSWHGASASSTPGDMNAHSGNGGFFYTQGSKDYHDGNSSGNYFGGSATGDSPAQIYHYMHYDADGTENFFKTFANNLISTSTFMVTGSEEEPAGASGDWTGQEGNIATCDTGGTPCASWSFETPSDGWAVYVEDEMTFVAYDGSDWALLTGLVPHESLVNLYGCDSETNECWHFANSAEHALATQYADGSQGGLVQAGKTTDWDRAYGLRVETWTDSNDIDFTYSDNDLTAVLGTNIDFGSATSSNYISIGANTPDVLDYTDGDLLVSDDVEVDGKVWGLDSEFSGKSTTTQHLTVGALSTLDLVSLDGGDLYVGDDAEIRDDLWVEGRAYFMDNIDMGDSTFGGKVFTVYGTPGTRSYLRMSTDSQLEFVNNSTLNVGANTVVTWSPDVTFGANVTSTDSFHAPEICLDGSCRTTWPSGGGAGGAWTAITNAIHPNTTTDTVLVGKNTLTSAANALEVEGDSVFNGDITVTGGDFTSATNTHYLSVGKSGSIDYLDFDDGELYVKGNLEVDGDMYFTNTHATGTHAWYMTDNASDAFGLVQGAYYLKMDTTNDSEEITIGDRTVDQAVTFDSDGLHSSRGRWNFLTSVTSTNYLSVGSGGTSWINHAGGDLFVQDDLELDGDLFMQAGTIGVGTVPTTNHLAHFYSEASATTTIEGAGGTNNVALRLVSSDNYWNIMTNKNGGANSSLIFQYNDTSNFFDLDTSGNLTLLGTVTSTDLQFTGEIQPDGEECAAGQILKKTGANDWDCAADATGGGGGDGIFEIITDGIRNATNTDTVVMGANSVSDNTRTLEVTGDSYFTGNASTTGSLYIAGDLDVVGDYGLVAGDIPDLSSTYLSLSTWYATTTWSGNLTVDGTFIGNLTGNVTGNADTATALAANGGNCSAGNSPLGVDASGAVESCFDVWTEAENTAADYVQDGCVDCLNATEIEDIYVLNTSDVMSGTLQVSGTSFTSDVFIIVGEDTKSSVDGEAGDIFVADDVEINDDLFVDGTATFAENPVITGGSAALRFDGGSNQLNWTRGSGFSFTDPLIMATSTNYLVVGGSVGSDLFNYAGGDISVADDLEVEDDIHVGDDLTIAGFATSTGGLFTQGNLHAGGTFTVDGHATTSANLYVGGTTNLDGQVGINYYNTSTMMLFVSQDGTPPTAPAWLAADTAVFSRNNNVAIQLHSPTDKKGNLLFSDDVRGEGRIIYDHNVEELQLWADSTEVTSYGAGSTATTTITDTGSFQICGDTHCLMFTFDGATSTETIYAK